MKSILISKVVGLPIIAKTVIGGGLVLGSLGVGAVATHHSFTYQEKLSIPFATKTVEDDTQFTGTRKVITAGSNGSRVRTYKVTKADGIQLSKVVVGDNATKQPTEEVVQVGILDKSQTTEEENIPFDKQQINNPDMLQGASSATQKGADGTKVKTFEVLSVKGVTKSKTLVKEEVTKQPVSEIIHIGINYRVGAICYDGWRSFSTGSGTCSHHGGVNYWLYNYCSTHYSC